MLQRKKHPVKPAQVRRSPARGKSLLHEQLAQSIGGRILAGAYAPGDQLPNEAAWCEEFRVSRTAVREAIKTLGGKGLLISRPKIGSIVEPRARWNLLDRDVLGWHYAAINRAEFLDATQEARRLIEPGIASLAATKHKPNQLQQLKSALEDMRNARSAGDVVEPDVRFHAALLDCTNNEFIAPFAIVIEHTLGNLFDFTTRNNPKPESVIPLHEAVVNAVVRANAAEAREAMLRLLDDTDAVIAAGTESANP